ncbi:hypothetical protein [Bacillus toyonensis]|uniref:hypothetical protein n=1 Tax=Bacillus toyonensis TaxID=155322 RepID=UPI0020D28518|nr:hypothetical protein [Bacillus toyonensis]
METNSKKDKTKNSKKVLATGVAVATLMQPMIQPVTSIYAETNKVADDTQTTKPDSGTGSTGKEEGKDNNTTKPDDGKGTDGKETEATKPEEPGKEGNGTGEDTGNKVPETPTEGGSTGEQKPEEKPSKYPKWIDEGYSDWVDEEKDILNDMFKQDLTFKKASIKNLFGDVMLNYGGYEFKLNNGYALTFTEDKAKLRTLVDLILVDGYGEPIKLYTNSKINDKVPSLAFNLDASNFKTYYTVNLNSVKHLNDTFLSKEQYTFVTSMDDLKSRIGADSYYFVYNTLAGKVNGEVVKDMSKFEPTISKDGVTEVNMDLQFLNLVPITYAEGTNITATVEPSDKELNKELTQYYDTSKFVVTDALVDVQVTGVGKNEVIKSLKINDKPIYPSSANNLKVSDIMLESGTDTQLKLEGTKQALATDNSTFSKKGLSINNAKELNKENWIKDKTIELGYQSKKELSSLQLYLNGVEIDSYMFSKESAVKGMDFSLNTEDEKIKAHLTDGVNTLTVMDGDKQHDVQFQFDSEAPVNNGTTLNNFKSSFEGVSYFNEKPSITLNFTDKNKVEKLTYVDSEGKEVEVKDPNGKEIELDLSKELPKDFVVYDELGNATSKFSLKDLTGVTLEKKSVVYNDKPTVEIVNKKDTKEIDGKLFLKDKKTDLQVKIGDKHVVSKYNVTLNGDSVASSQEPSKTVKDYVYNQELNESTVLEFKADAENIVGNSEKQSLKVFYDNDVPNVTTISTPNSVTDMISGMYSSEPVTLHIKAEDLGVAPSGVDKILVIDKEGTTIKELNYSDSLTYTLTKSGSYNFQAVDKMGNKSNVVALNKLLNGGFKSNNFNLVQSNPSIQSDLDKTVSFVDSKGGLWFKEIPTITSKIADDVPFKILKVAQNDKLVVDKDYTNEDKGTNEETIKSNISEMDITPEGKISYNIHLEDVLGEKLDNSKEFFIDLHAPNVVGTDKDGFYKENNLGVFIQDKLKLNFKTDETLSGLKKLEVLDLTDKVIDEVEGEGSEIKYTIKKSGVYRFRFTDNVGNVSKTYSMTELGFQADKVYKVEAKPTIKADFGTPTAEIDGKKWYNKTPFVPIKMHDDIGVFQYKVMVNGNVVGENTYFSLENDVNYDLDLAKIDRPADGRYNVKVTTMNFLGEEISYEETVYVDDTKPEVSGLTINSEYHVYGEAFYSKEKLQLDFNLGDYENSSGVSHINIYDKDKTLIKEVPVSDLKASYTLEESGQYFVQVVDKLGNKSDIKALNEVLPSLGSNNYVYDTFAPQISYELPNPQYVDGNKNWYNAVFPITVSSTDNSAMDNYKVIVNGKEIVTKGLADDVSKRDSFLLDLNQAERNSDGSYNVEIQVTDKSKNLTTRNFTIFVDDVKPSITGGHLLGTYNVEPEANYSKSPLSVNISLTDVGYSSGVDKVYVLDENRNVVDTVKLSEDRFSYELGRKGAYFFQVEDKLGNKSQVYAMTDLFPHLQSNNFVVDNTNPTGEINVANPQHNKGGEEWFKENQNVNLDLGDETALKQVIVSVNGKEMMNKSFNGVVTKDNFSLNTADAVRNPDGSYNIVMTIKDKAGNEITKTKTIFVDDTKPVVKSFIFTDSGYKEGESITVDESSYGFYFQNGVGVQVNVEDVNASSGLKELTFKLSNVNGKVTEQVVPISNGVAHVSIPTNFKGQVRAVASDNVGNLSDSAKPSGVITEDGNWHVNTSNINLALPPTQYATADGQPLYNSDVSLGFTLTDSVSGFRNVNWSIDGKQAGNTEINNGGGVSGYSFDVTNRDSNLVTGLKSVGVVGENRNNIKVNLNAMDRVGHTSTNEVAFSIDKDAPVLSLSYDSEDGDNGYFNHNRVAYLTIKERNFRASDVQFTGNVPKNISWSSNGDVHTATITFSDELEYDWGVSYTDLAGNKGNDVQSQKFTIDKTAPSMSVDYNNNNPQNGNYYNTERTATVTINDKNFDPSRVVFEGNGGLSNWSSNGEVHSATVTYKEDGEYAFKVSSKDKAGNVSQPYDSGKFIIDATKPELAIAGVTNGASYKGKVLPIIEFKDTNMNQDKVKVTLKGNKKGTIELSGKMEEGRLILNDLPKDESYDDIYNLDAHIEDKAGNVSEQNVKFVVNRFGSDFNLDDLDFVGKYLQKVKGDVTLEEVSKTELDLDQLQIIVSHNGTPRTLTKDADFKVDHKVDEFGYHHYKYIVNKRLFEKEGSYSILAISVDKHGDKNDTRQTELKFIVDRTPPTVVVIGADDNTTYKTDKLKLELDIKDNIKLDSYGVYIDGKEVKPYIENEKIYVDVKGSDKPQDVEVIAYDKAANMKKTEVKGVLITTNWWLNLKANKYFQGLSWTALGAFLVGLLLLIRRYILGKKKDNEEQENNSRRLDEIRSTELAKSKQPTGQATGQASKEVASTKDEK